MRLQADLHRAVMIVDKSETLHRFKIAFNLNLSYDMMKLTIRLS